MSTNSFDLNKCPGMLDLEHALFSRKNDDSRIVKFGIDGIRTETSIKDDMIFRIQNGITTVEEIPVILTGVSRDKSGLYWDFFGTSCLWHKDVKGTIDIQRRTGTIDVGDADMAVRQVSFAGNEVFGYNRGLTIDGSIFCIFGEGTRDMQIGQILGLKGNSRGYIPSNLNGPIARIVGFCSPFSDGETDHIVQVQDMYGDIGLVKPSNIHF